MSGARERILLVGLPPDQAGLVRRGLTLADDGAAVAEVDADDAVARISDDADAVEAVLTWDTGGAVAFAQRVAAVDRELAVLIAAPPETFPAVDRALRFAPFLGQEATAWSAGELELVGAELAEAAERTRRRRAHRQIVARESERLASNPERRRPGYVEHLLRHAPIGVATLDGAGAIAASNPEAARLLGADPDEVVGRTLDTLVPETDRDEVRRLVSAAGQSSGARVVIHVGAEIQKRYVEVSASRHLGAADEPMTVVVLGDVTERERAAARLRHLQAVTDAALGHLDLDSLLDELMSRIRGALGVDTVAVLLPDETDSERALRMRASQGLPDDLDDVRIRVGEGFAGRIARDREPLAIGDVQPHHVVSPVFGASVASLLGVPLVVGRELIGVLHVGSVKPREFEDDDRTLLQLVGDRVALAINQARTYQQEHETAAVLQRSLLPQRLPQPAGMRLAATYQPGGAGVDVGGDWYDVIELGGGRLAVSIGDVVGRGLKAATVMGQLRAALRAYSVEGHGPGAALSRLNELMLHGAGRLATAVHAAYDPGTGLLSIAVAGHPPPLLLGADGESRLLDVDGGPALGVVPYAAYGETTVPLDPGARLVLYTDGLVERRDEALDDSLARLVAASHATPPGAQALADRLVEQMLGEDDNDDAALLVVESLRLGPRLEIELPAAPAALASARTELRRWLDSREAPSSVADDLVIACGEACANVVEHAYGPGAATFWLAAEEADGDFVVTVRDSGNWREQRHVGRGRGKTLMHALADEVTVESSDEGTTVRLRRRARAGDAP